MSPDEGISAREAVARVIAGTLWRCPGAENVVPDEVHYRVADAVLAWRAEADFHRPTASVEADQPRGLRPLAPEGIDAAEIALLRKVEDAAREMPRATPAPGGAFTAHPFAIQAGVVWSLDLALRKLDEHRAAPPQADAKADLARASHSLAPEGQNPTASAMAGITLATVIDLNRQIDQLRESWIAARHVVFAARDYCNASEDHDYLRGKLGRVVSAYDQRHHEPDAGVSGGPSSAAGAASAPEGFSVTDEMVSTALRQLDFTWPESRDHMRRALVAAFAQACIVRRPLTAAEVAHGKSLVPEVEAMEGPAG